MHKDVIPNLPKENKGVISSSATSIPSKITPEDNRYLLSYKRYLDKKCELLSLEKSSHRKALEYLRLIGDSASLSEVRQKISSDLKPVEDSDDYRFLYSDLSKDVEIYELKLNRINRLFFFVADNIFFIRLLKASHLETKKHRK